MPNWNEQLDEARAIGGPNDVLRRKYLKRLQAATKRNVIIYYSGWLQKPTASGLGIEDEDKNGLMSTVNKLDRSKGLDLILHTPGGDIASTESFVDYLHSMFGTDIRAIVPQLAMSGGTMLACACKTIIMGKQSSLGPVDPQLWGLAAHGVIEEFNEACKDIKADPSRVPIWQPIMAKYAPTLIGECQKAIKWSELLVRQWLARGMLSGDPQQGTKIDQIVTGLGNHALTLSHARHLSAESCRTMGLKVEMMEDQQKLQDAILDVHHASMLTLSMTTACKIIENHLGVAYIKVVRTP